MDLEGRKAEKNNMESSNQEGKQYKGDHDAEENPARRKLKDEQFWNAKE